MAESRKISLFDRARIGLTNLIVPKAYQGAWESARYSIHRTRVDAPPPQDFKSELNESARRELVRLSRWLEKNSGFYKQIIRDTAIYAVGDGIHLQALGGDKDWQSLIEAEWEQECQSPEVTGRFSMLEALYIICKSIERDGEIFAIKAKAGGIPKFQLIETHRINTPTELLNTPHMNEGILYDKVGKPLAYFVSQSDGSYKKIPANSVMHIYDPEHASMGRACPPHQHAINNLRDELDLLSMEKVAAKDNSRISRILRTADPTPDLGDLGLGVGTNTNPPPTNPDAISRALGGVTAVINPNEELKEHVPNRPSQAFNGFIEHLRRDSVMGGLPFEFVADPTKIGGATSRLVVAKAGRYLSHRQDILIKRFLQKYFEFWLGTKIARGDLPSARNWWKADWQVTKPVSVDNGRDSVNARADLQMGIRSPQDVFQENGKNYERELIQKAKALQFRDRVAKDFNIDPERLLSIKTSADLQTETMLKQTELQVLAKAAPAGPAGVNPDGTPAEPQQPAAPQIPEDALKQADLGDKPVNQEASDTTDPELDPLEETPDGVSAIGELTTNIDTVPKQNQGLSRSREQPPSEYA